MIARPQTARQRLTRQKQECFDRAYARVLAKDEIVDEFPHELPRLVMDLGLACAPLVKATCDQDKDGRKMQLVWRMVPLRAAHQRYRSGNKRQPTYFTSDIRDAASSKLLSSLTPGERGELRFRRRYPVVGYHGEDVVDFGEEKIDIVDELEGVDDGSLDEGKVGELERGGGGG